MAKPDQDTQKPPREATTEAPKQSFSFPFIGAGVVVEASSFEEAVEKAKKLAAN